MEDGRDARSPFPGPLVKQLWSGFVDYVEGCFRRSAETVEAGQGHNLPNAGFAGLGAQAQSDFLRA
jgi:hypothetical protein